MDRETLRSSQEKLLDDVILNMEEWNIMRCKS